MRDLQQCIDDHIAKHPEDKGITIITITIAITMVNSC
jgi:hypothetical protein